MAGISHLKSRQASDYNIGDFDQRPWGFWLVTDVKGRKNQEKEYCEKVIVVAPGKILSLQSHEFRNETWTVLDGTLIAIIDGECKTLSCGEKIEVPAGAVHSMANLGDHPCIVKEQQSGICRESDITRYLDAYGRTTAGAKDVTPSISIYHSILEQAKNRQQKYA